MIHSILDCINSHIGGDVRSIELIYLLRTSWRWGKIGGAQTRGRVLA